MLLIYSDPSAWANLDDATQGAIGEEYGTFTQTIVDSKEFVTGDPLQGAETATTVQVKNGKRLTTDGPFAETKEALGGYYVVDVADLDRAHRGGRRDPRRGPRALAHRGAPGHGAAGLIPAVIWLTPAVI